MYAKYLPDIHHGDQGSTAKTGGREESAAGKSLGDS
jgi:hypothetical protein